MITLGNEIDINVWKDHFLDFRWNLKADNSNGNFWRSNRLWTGPLRLYNLHARIQKYGKITDGVFSEYIVSLYKEKVCSPPYCYAILQDPRWIVQHYFRSFIDSTLLWKSILWKFLYRKKLCELWGPYCLSFCLHFDKILNHQFSFLKKKKIFRFDWKNHGNASSW